MESSLQIFLPIIVPLLVNPTLAAESHLQGMCKSIRDLEAWLCIWDLSVYGRHRSTHPVKATGKADESGATGAAPPALQVVDVPVLGWRNQAASASRGGGRQFHGSSSLIRFAA